MNTHMSVKSIYINKSVTIAGKNIIHSLKIMPLLLILMIQGCWNSENDLIPKAKSDDPFNGARNIVFSQGGSLKLLSRVGSNNEFTLYIPVESRDKSPVTFKFHDLTPIWKVFGRKKYIMGMSSPDKNKKIHHQYYYLIIDKNEATGFGLGIPKKVSSLNELIAKINKAEKSQKLVKAFAGTIEISSAVQTNMAKRIIDAEFKERKRKAEEQRKKDAELARRKSAKGFEICNRADENAYIAFAAKEAKTWISHGWYKIPIGKCRTLAKVIGGKTYYYFAQGDKGGKWNGKYNLCFQPNDKFTIKGFKDCEDRGYKTGNYKKIEVADNVWELRETLVSQERSAYAPAIQKSSSRNNVGKLAELDIGEGVYVQGYFSDELAYIMRIDHQNQRVKVQRPSDGTAIWVGADKIISREESTVNDVGRAAVAIGVFYCIFNPEDCKK